MAMDKKALIFLLLFSAFSAFQSVSGYRALQAVMAVAVPHEAQVVEKLGRAGSRYRRYLTYSIPALGPGSAGRVSVSIPMWREAQRGDRFEIFYVAENPWMSVRDPQAVTTRNVLWGIAAFLALGCAAAMAVVVLVLRDPLVAPKQDSRLRRRFLDWD